MTPDAEVGGYAEVRVSYQVGVDGVPWNLTERIRPSFEISARERVTAEAVIEAAMTQGRVANDEVADLLVGALLDNPMLAAADCTYAPEPRYDSVSDYLSVERLHVDFNLPGADITVGRQAINWGSALVFHPTDLLREVLVTEPWRDRGGLNAVKADVAMGDHSLVGVVAVPDDLSSIYQDDEPEVPVLVAGKLTLRGFETDAAAVVHARTDGEWFAGGDLRGTLGVGWWVEGGWHGRAEDSDDEDGPEVVVGIDYSLPWLETVYLAGEYRFDGTGVAPEDYDFAQRAGMGSSALAFDCSFQGADFRLVPPTVEGGTRTTLGQHYVDAILNVGITQDVGVNAALILNVADGTGMVVPGASVKVGERVAVNAGAQIPVGEDGEFKPASESLIYEAGGTRIDLSGLLPDATVNAWVRYSF